tara:strand:+ start:4391 stop:4660 length:270 start_codon:yes stop_codon:yes gene_type:complete
MAYKNTNDHLQEMLGKKGSVEVFTTVAQTSKDWYAIHFVTESTITNCTITGATNDSNLDGKTIPAGTVIFAPFTAITLSGSSVAIGYNN